MLLLLFLFAFRVSPLTVLTNHNRCPISSFHLVVLKTPSENLEHLGLKQKTLVCKTDVTLKMWSLPQKIGLSTLVSPVSECVLDHPGALLRKLSPPLSLLLF